MSALMTRLILGIAISVSSVCLVGAISAKAQDATFVFVYRQATPPSPGGGSGGGSGGGGGGGGGGPSTGGPEGPGSTEPGVEPSRGGVRMSPPRGASLPIPIGGGNTVHTGTPALPNPHYELKLVAAPTPPSDGLLHGVSNYGKFAVSVGGRYVTRYGVRRFVAQPAWSQAKAAAAWAAARYGLSRGLEGSAMSRFIATVAPFVGFGANVASIVMIPTRIGCEWPSCGSGPGESRRQLGPAPHPAPSPVPDSPR